MSSAHPCATFRDPSGSLSFEDDLVVRRVGASARHEILEFLDTPLCHTLQNRGELIESTVEETAEGLRLVHPKIRIPTYPWEWTPSQWQAAAELTLDLCDQALAAGWALKDATPLNILFSGTRPIFVDLLSFERRNPRASLWLPYAQYIRTFLLPLLMDRMLHWPLSLTLFKRDGYEPADCYAALGWRTRLSRDAFWPVTLPTLLDKRKSAEAAANKPPAANRDPEIATNVLKRTFQDLRRRTHRAVPNTNASEWSDYTQTLTHYTADESRRKLEWVRGALAQTKPGLVLDIGANTGEFSALAAETGADVVALERDQAAADRLYQMARQRKLSIQTIHADLARPTPAVGWQNSESVALLPRLEGQFDLVLMLAVIHHLLLMEQIPLPAILDLCYSLTRRHLILEWVPVEDPMFQSLLRGRDSLYGSLSEDDLLTGCNGRFHTLSRLKLHNGRILFLFERID